MRAFEKALMDWHMPAMDGLEASRIIKRHGRLPHVPKIVVVTAFRREDFRHQSEKIGIEGYLLKPVNASLLYDTLVDLFAAGAPVSRPLRAPEKPHEYTAPKPVHSAACPNICQESRSVEISATI